MIQKTHYNAKESSVPVCMSSLLVEPIFLLPCNLISQLQDSNKYTHWVKIAAVFVTTLPSNTHSLALINTHIRTWCWMLTHYLP